MTRERSAFLLAAIAMIVLLPACVFGQDQTSDVPPVSDSERLDDLGARLGDLWPIEPGCSTLLVSFDPKSPHVDNPPGRKDAVSSYNAHEALEAGFANAGGYSLVGDERHLVLDRVKVWREDYAQGLANTEKAVEGYSDLMKQDGKEPSLIEECQFQADLLVHRRTIALQHVDALLD